MSTRTQLAALVVLALVCALLGGCSGSSDRATAANPFTGRWAGQYYDAADKQTGAMRLTVTPDGTVTGDFDNVTIGMSGTIRGIISAQGQFEGTYTVPGILSSVVLSGLLAKGRDRHLTGSLTQGGERPLNIDLLARAVIDLGDGYGTVTPYDRVLKDGTHVRLVDFMPRADCTVRLTMQPSAQNGLADPYLLLYDSNGPTGALLASDDNGGGGTNAKLTFDFAEGKKYVIGFNTSQPDDFGGYVYQMLQLPSRPKVPAPAPVQGGPKSAR